MKIFDPQLTGSVVIDSPDFTFTEGSLKIGTETATSKLTVGNPTWSTTQTRYSSSIEMHGGQLMSSDTQVVLSGQLYSETGGGFEYTTSGDRGSLVVVDGSSVRFYNTPATASAPGATATIGASLQFKNDGSDNWEVSSNRAVHIGHKSTTGNLANNAWIDVQTNIEDGVYLVSAVPADLTTAPTNTRSLSWLYIYNGGTLYEQTITDSGVNWRVSGGDLQIQNTSGGTINIAYNLLRLY